MSRIGKKTTKLESGVEVKQSDETIIVKGPKGEISIPVTGGFKVEIADGSVAIQPPAKELTKGKDKALYGLYGSLLRNALIGVTKGFTKKLILVGVGYRAQLQGQKLVMSLGYSHPVEFEVPSGLSIKCPDQNTIEITGIRKDEVGQFSAVVRKSRPPEPYKGKGILYDGEKIRRKEGKSGKK
ncbi:MAG: 50S ribosomal protein L6 [Candidatus Caenarcaniphilales bacterium]|nr:50S ribosomal protein L6 [Candidatus Caenarcaniphilales bacterium]